MNRFMVKDTLENVNNEEAKVILLIGQSNATGVAINSYLEKNDNETYQKALAGYNNVLINYITENGVNSSDNEFVSVKLGQGAGLDFFGPEVGLADYISKEYPNETVFIIKYSWGGTILDNQWLDGNMNRGELYDASISFAKASLEYLKQKGYLPKLVGVCWMQGESDAIDIKIANKYYDNTKKLVSYYRSDLKDYYEDHLLFVDAGIQEIEVWPYFEIVNNGKEKFSKENEYNVYFRTTPLGYTTDLEPSDNPDIAHYDSISELELGRKFASYIK